MDAQTTAVNLMQTGDPSVDKELPIAVEYDV